MRNDVVNGVDQEFLKQLQASDLGRKILQEREEATQQRRREAAQAIEQLRSRLEQEAPALQAEIERAKTQLDQAYEDLRSAKLAYDRAFGTSLHLSSSLEHRIGRHEATLRETAPEAIGEFLRELRQRERKVMEAAGDAIDMPGAVELLGAIRELRPSVEALKIEPDFDVISRRLGELRGRYETFEASVTREVRSTPIPSLYYREARQEALAKLSGRLRSLWNRTRGETKTTK